MNRLIQPETPTVALLGAPGAYHDIATDVLVPQADEESRQRCGSFEQIISTLVSGEADKAVIAVYNSEIGALWDAYSLIASHNIYAVGEVQLRIRHNLLVTPGVNSHDDITTVVSNPKALSQCHEHLEQHLPNAELKEEKDTATAAQVVAEQADPAIAAIASRQAAEIYGLDVLASSIETNPNNLTRFLLFQGQQGEVDGANKTSLILATANRSGALHSALGVWANRGIDLSMLESRLVPHQVRSPWGAYLHANGQHEILENMRQHDGVSPWDSHFYIDVEAGLQEPSMRAALTELQSQQGAEVRILGSYVAGQVVE